ncbi:MAG: Mut7-C RNAse domain-containing protein [Deltaproteobacteria bacterium]
MTAKPKFITDASLAGLAKWLRMLGFDTIIYGGEAGRVMMRLSASQSRIVLTRRRDMMERQFSGKILFLPEGGVGAQLLFVISKLSLKINLKEMHTLCLGCNEALHPVEKEKVRDRVPQFVFENNSCFNQCDTCQKIYWPGTHQLNALHFLEENHIKISA